MAKTTIELERRKKAGEGYVELRSGGRVSKDAYDLLSRTDQARLQEMGVEGFQAEMIKRQAEPQATVGDDYIQLPSGEYVLKTEFEALTAEQQEELKSVGVEEFLAGQEAEQAAWEAQYIDIGGEGVPREQWDALTDAEKARLQEIGVAAFNAERAAEQEVTTVLLDNGERVDKEAYNDLSSSDQSYLRANGVDAFNTLLEQRQTTLQPYLNETTNQIDVPALISGVGADEATALLTAVGVSHASDVVLFYSYATDGGVDIRRMISELGEAQATNVLDAAGVQSADMLVDGYRYVDENGNIDIWGIIHDFTAGKAASILSALDVSNITALLRVANYINESGVISIGGLIDEYGGDIAVSTLQGAGVEHASELVTIYPFIQEDGTIDVQGLLAKYPEDYVEHLINTVGGSDAYLRLAINPFIQDDGTVDTQGLVDAFGVEKATEILEAAGVADAASVVAVAPFVSEGGVVDIAAINQALGTEQATAALAGVGVVNAVSLTPQEQFEWWRTNDPTAPADAEFRGEAEDGGFAYFAYSAAELEVETADGKKTVKLSEWDKMPEIKQFEFILGRPPTLTEWTAYCLAREGAELNFSILNLPGLRTIQGAFEQLFIPGEQKTERWLRVKDEASDEWYRAYPNLTKEGIVSTSFEELGFPAVKAMYPDIKITDITGKEWATTGLSVALWTMPLWLPKVIAGIKFIGNKAFNIKLTTKTPIIKFQSPKVTTDLGLAGVKTTWRPPVSVRWGAGLQRAGLSANVETAAFRAGAAATELRAATRVASRAFKSRAVLPAKIASRLKIAQASSLSADTKFIQVLNGLRLTARQIKLLEQATGFKGLLKPIKNVGTALKNLDAAWGHVSDVGRIYRINSRQYVQALGRVARARTALAKAADRLDAVLRPRYTEGAPAPRFTGYEMKWSRGGGAIYPEGPAPKSSVLSPEQGGFGWKGTMTKEFYEKQVQAQIDSWRKPQSWERPEGWTMPKGGTPATALVEAPTEALMGMPKYTVPTLNKLTLIARYAAQLADDVKISGRPLFDAGGRPIRLPIPIPAGIGDVMPAIVPATIATIINNVGLTTEQLTGVGKLTTAQVANLSRVMGVSRAELSKIASQGKLGTALVSQAYAVGNELVRLSDVQTEALAKILTETQVKPITTLQTAELAKTLDLTETGTQALVNTITEIQSATQPVTATETATQTKTMVATATPLPASQIVPKPRAGLSLTGILPGSEGEKIDERGRLVLPTGSYTWKQGIGWRSIVPPYDQKKPLWSKLPPKGARTGGRTPTQTIQVIGDPVSMPQEVSIDLGVSDIVIRGGKKPTIHFTGGGMKTDVGRRIPGPEKGLSLGGDAGGEVLEVAEPTGIGETRPNALPTRSKVPKKRKEKMSWLDEVATLKGYRF